MKKNKEWFICRDIMTMCALNKKVKKEEIKAKNIISIHQCVNGTPSEVEVFWRVRRDDYANIIKDII